MDDMKENKKISVCIPFYNIESYVNRCLDSVLNNTYKNLEVICVNDASKDNTLKILKEYEKKDSRVIVIDKNVNEGLTSARNSALECCTGDFIAIIDGDDWIHRKYFEILLSVQETTKAEVVYCGSKSCNNYEKDKDVELSELQIDCFGLEDLINNWTAKSRIWGRLYSKQIVGKKRLPCNITMGEDTLYNLSILCSREKIKIAGVNADLYYYFNREDSIVHTSSHSKIVYLSFYFLKHLEEYSQKGKKVILFQALNSMLAYRYLESYSSDRKLIKGNCKKLYNQCVANWSKVDGMSRIKKIEYKILYYIPIIYRLIRIIKDPTMLIWEKNQRIINKKT